LVVLILGGAAVVLAGAVLTWRPARPAIPPVPPDPPAGPAVEETLRADAKLTWRITYAGCGRVADFSAPAGGMTGWTRERLAAAMPDWQVLQFRPDLALLVRVSPGLCPEMQVFRTLRWHEGRLAVFYGRPPHLLFKETIEPVPEGLVGADRQRLMEGIVVTGDEGVLAQLEGIEE
jgi:hypothetical protein